MKEGNTMSDPVRAMLPCEACRQPATHCCAGLDIPAVYFCASHATEHERTCPSCRNGLSQTVRMGAEVTA